MLTVSVHSRLLKKLRQKDSQQVELEQKEQGFSLYLNGANTSRTRPLRARHPLPTLPTTQQHSRTAKTAGRLCYKVNKMYLLPQPLNEATTQLGSVTV